MKKYFFPSIILIFSSLPFVASATTPTVSNVSGMIQTGQTLTVSGAHMVNENKTNWNNYMNGSAYPNAYGFEGTSPTADFYSDMGTCTGVYDSTFKLMGNKSIKFNINTPGPCHVDQVCGSYCAAVSRTSYPYGDPVSFPDVWFRAYSSWELVSGYWVDSHMKFTMTYPQTDYYYNAGHTANGDYPSRMEYKVGSNSYDFPIPSGQMAVKRWYCLEAHFNGTHYEYFVDGQSMASGTSDVNVPSVSGFWIGMINLGTERAINVNNWIDNFTWSSTRVYPSSTIEIANSSNYAIATKKYQEPVYLSDGSVQIKADLTGLGSGPYYLFVTNNRQETSTAYSLSVSSDTTPPAAPSGLSVS
jgi:hypothetical protein